MLTDSGTRGMGVRIGNLLMGVDDIREGALNISEVVFDWNLYPNFFKVKKYY